MSKIQTKHFRKCCQFYFCPVEKRKTAAVDKITENKQLTVGEKFLKTKNDNTIRQTRQNALL